MKKIILSIIIILFLLGGAGVLFAWTYYNNGIKAVSKESEEVIVVIEPGQSAYSILNTLDEAGLVNDVLCGKIYLKLNEVGNLQSNSLRLNKNMSIEELFAVIANPTDEHIVQFQVTILDGATLPEIAESIATSLEISSDEVMNLLNDEAFLNTLISEYWFITDEIFEDGIRYPLEGYLYPETYKLNANNTLEDVIRASLDMMDSKLTAVKSSIDAMGFSAHEFLTFASVVERESLFDTDRPIIAGVFKNRLDDNMLLQSDITVNYAWERTGVDVSYDHLKIDSPYNTYKYKGLPIGPISTVSAVTIDSCVNYTEHDYLYFFAKADGTVLYSKSLAEHNAAVKANKWY